MYSLFLEFFNSLLYNTELLYPFSHFELFFLENKPMARHHKKLI